MRLFKGKISKLLVFLFLGLPVLGTLLAGCGSPANSSIQPAAAPTTINRVPSTWTPALPLPPQTTSTPALPATTAGAATQTTPPATPYITPLPEEFQPEITSEPASGTGQAVSCYFSADYAVFPLSQQIKQSQDIVQVQVTNVGPAVWDTPDGKQPAEPCSSDNYQYSPVEITIKESYKGQIGPGTKLVLWLSGAPGSYKQGNYDYFPKNGDALIFFLGDEQNLRRDTRATPLNTRIVWARYRTEPPGSNKWVSQITQTPFTLEWLRAVIKDPAIEPTPTPSPPTVTPYARAGQTLQPTSFYHLDKAVRAVIKAPMLNPPLVGDEKPGSDRFSRLVKALDQPLKVIKNLDTYPNSDQGIFFGFELADQTYASFTYYPDTNTLVHQLNDTSSLVELEVPADLKAIFGL